MIRRPPISTLFPSPPLSGSRSILFPAAAADRGTVARHCVPQIGESGQGPPVAGQSDRLARPVHAAVTNKRNRRAARSEEHTSELQSPCNLVCRLLLEKKKRY